MVHSSAPRVLSKGGRELLAWPPYVVGGEVFLQRLVAGLADSEKWTADSWDRGQATQLVSLIAWAVEKSPYYRGLGMHARKLASFINDPIRFWEVWRNVPLLTKKTLRTQGKQINSRVVPNGHGPVDIVNTSGSTGIPVQVNTTRVTRSLWEALTVREHLWQKRDFSKRLGIIRHRSHAERDPNGMDLPSWGAPMASLYKTGPCSVIHNGLPIEDHVKWLRRFDPHYLLCYPSIADEILRQMGVGGKPPALEEVRFIAEPLDPKLERQLMDEWGVRSTDMYSANEVGHIAFRCREEGNLHVQSETILVEVIDESGMTCGPGQTGRVVVTPLHNFATPLIRYELGDYATVGEACACGRGLPVLTQVMGRVRNLLRTPDGRVSWPVSFAIIRRITPILQAQWVQLSLDMLQLRIVASRPLTQGELEKTRELAQQALGYPFHIDIVMVDAVERGPTGKFEEFLSLVGV